MKDVMMQPEVEMRECQRCGKEVPRDQLARSYDCHGIPFRLVCTDCMDEIDERGFDGVAYTSADECIDYDY